MLGLILADMPAGATAGLNVVRATASVSGSSGDAWLRRIDLRDGNRDVLLVDERCWHSGLGAAELWIASQPAA